MGAGMNGGRGGIGGLLRELAEGGTMLVRQEVRLARLEVGDAALGVGKGTAFVALGGVLALLGGLSLLAGIILLVGDQWLPRDQYWLAALIMVGFTGGIAALLAMRGQ